MIFAEIPGMAVFLDHFFFVFHTALTLFNMFGWIFPATRKWNLFTLLLTAGSWFILGIWFGWGYCACTDWHWDVRESLGYHDQQRSYIHFLLLKLTGINFNEDLVEWSTLAGFLISLILSLVLNIRDHKRKRTIHAVHSIHKNHGNKDN
jgi:hypothetical protein